MPPSVDQFGKSLVGSRLMQADELHDFWATLPRDVRPKTGKELAQRLFEHGKLTRFQAEVLLSGSQLPLVVGDYVLLSRIGAGGMGQVYKAEHRHMKRLVAIKLLPPAVMQDEAAVKRFQREVQAAAKLSHPNIVASLDARNENGVWCLVMEYVEGSDLSVIVREHGPLPIPDAIDCILQTARGLAYAHAQGIVHRDIKPANLLRDKSGTIKILDMGLARIDNAVDNNELQLTNTGVVMGTVDYMAPEQAQDTRSADARSDIYSLGCTLYRLLTGEAIYHSDTAVKKILAHLHAPIPALSDKRSDVPEGLEALFRKMVAKSPAERFQDASQLLDELSRWIQAYPSDSTSATKPKELTATGVAERPSLATQAANPTTAPSFLLTLPNLPTKQKAKASPRKLLVPIVAAGLVVAVALWIASPRPTPEPTPSAPPSAANPAANPAVNPTTNPTRFALRFEGSTSYVEFPSLSLSMDQALTLELWLCSEVSEFRVLLRRDDDFLQLSKSESTTRWGRVSNDKFQGAGGHVSPIANWTHFAGVADTNGKLALFIDGKQFDEATPTMFQPNVKRWPNSMGFFGRFAESNGSARVAGFRLSSGVRYTHAFTPERNLVADASTLALYPCQDGEGDELRDVSGNAQHAKLIDAQWVQIDDWSPAPNDGSAGRKVPPTPAQSAN